MTSDVSGPIGIPFGLIVLTVPHRFIQVIRERLRIVSPKRRFSSDLPRTAHGMLWV